MFFKNTVLLIEVFMLFVGIGCTQNGKITPAKKSIKTENVYNFEDMIVAERIPNQHTPQEYENFYKEVSNILNTEDMDEVVLTVNGIEITRGKFETEKKFDEFQYNEVSVKEVIYSLIRPIVIKSEAERLNLKPSQNKIDEYMVGVKYAFTRNDEATEYLYANIRGRGIEIEDYLKEQEDMAYDMFQRDALYQYIKESKGYANVEDYIYDLMKYANIKFYDSKIEKDCLE